MFELDNVGQVRISTASARTLGTVVWKSILCARASLPCAASAVFLLGLSENIIKYHIYTYLHRSIWSISPITRNFQKLWKLVPFSSYISMRITSSFHVHAVQISSLQSQTWVMGKFPVEPYCHIEGHQQILEFGGDQMATSSFQIM